MGAIPWTSGTFGVSIHSQECLGRHNDSELRSLLLRRHHCRYFANQAGNHPQSLMAAWSMVALFSITGAYGDRSPRGTFSGPFTPHPLRSEGPNDPTHWAAAMLSPPFLVSVLLRPYSAEGVGDLDFGADSWRWRRFRL